MVLPKTNIAYVQVNELTKNTRGNGLSKLSTIISHVNAGAIDMSQVTLKDLINEAYLEAILTATHKGLKGEKAKIAAFAATARYVSKETGKSISTELVSKAVVRH